MTRWIQRRNVAVDRAQTEDPRKAYVYMLGTSDGGSPKSYVGWTFDVQARLASHNSGRGAKATKGRQWRVIHTIECESKSEAMSQEWHLKKNKALRYKIRLKNGLVRKRQ